MVQASGVVEAYAVPNKTLSVSGVRLPAHFLRTASSFSSSHSPPGYTYIIFNRTASISRRPISQYTGRTRRITLATALPYPATPTTRYLLIPPSSVLHMGVVMASVGEAANGGHQTADGDKGHEETGAHGARCFVTLEPAAASRLSSELPGA